MFNKSKSFDTAADRKLKELNSQLYEVNNYLLASAEEVIVTQGVIALYPEGADKTAAIKDAEKAKYLLLCRIGEYDGLMREYNERLTKTENRETTKEWRNTHSSSHKLIEIAYRNFYRRG